MTFLSERDTTIRKAAVQADSRPLDAGLRRLLTRANSSDGGFLIHAASVAALSVRVGVALGLSETDLRTLELAALVHDVGKINIPHAILTKTSALLDEEWEIMRRHPLEGVRLLESLVSDDVLTIVRGHHERWDGSGYPDGLNGEEIPLGARIVAVADAFCAMIESRPYRESRSRACAGAEILEQAGTQFDLVCSAATYRVCAGTRQSALRSR